MTCPSTSMTPVPTFILAGSPKGTLVARTIPAVSDSAGQLPKKIARICDDLHSAVSETVRARNPCFL